MRWLKLVTCHLSLVTLFMSAGDCTVTGAYLYTGDAADRITKSKENLQAVPLVRVNENAITDRELSGDITDELTGLRTDVTALQAKLDGRNVIINPMFDFFTFRGLTSYTMGVADGGPPRICADRWVIADPDSGLTWSRVAFPLGQTDVPDFPNYMLHWSQFEVLTKNPGFLGQRIDNVRVYAGKQVTWAIYVRAQTAITVQMQLTQHFGAGGTPSANVNVAPQSYVLVPNVWTELVYTVTLPSIAGKILGSDGANGPSWLEARCIMPQGALFEIDFAHARFNPGPNTGLFEIRSTVQEIQLINIYCERTQAVFSSSVATAYPCFYFNTPKRNIPTLLIESITAGSGAAIVPLSINGFYQNAAHSAIGIGVVVADAELGSGQPATDI